MSTERKNESQPANPTEQRHPTGKGARDEQTGAQLSGTQRLNENWTETKSELRKKFGQLTEEDLELKPGREQETIDRLGKRLGKTPEEARTLVQEISERQQRKPEA